MREKECVCMCEERDRHRDREKKKREGRKEGTVYMCTFTHIAYKNAYIYVLFSLKMLISVIRHFACQILDTVFRNGMLSHAGFDHI